MKIKIGDKVAYSVQFLRSIGEVTGELPAARGVVTDIKKLGQRELVSVDWGDENIPGKVISGNLAKVGANTRFAQC